MPGRSSHVQTLGIPLCSGAIPGAVAYRDSLKVVHPAIAAVATSNTAVERLPCHSSLMTHRCRDQALVPGNSSEPSHVRTVQPESLDLNGLGFITRRARVCSSHSDQLIDRGGQQCELQPHSDQSQKPRRRDELSRASARPALAAASAPLVLSAAMRDLFSCLVGRRDCARSVRPCSG